MAQSTQGWHDENHDLGPWIGYFLGILSAAYREFERRANILVGRGSKKALITTFISSLLADEFTVSALRRAAPGVSDAYISKVLGELKKAGVVEPIGPAAVLDGADYATCQTVGSRSRTGRNQLGIVGEVMATKTHTFSREGATKRQCLRARPWRGLAALPGPERAPR